MRRICLLNCEQIIVARYIQYLNLNVASRNAQSWRNAQFRIDPTLDLAHFASALRPVGHYVSESRNYNDILWFNSFQTSQGFLHILKG